MREPLVSLIIGNYNGAHILGECLDAVFAQTYPHLEVIVVDDASADDSLKVATSYSRVKVIANRRNRGLAHCRNRGLDEATGSYIAFIDNDAVLEPDWLEAMLEAVQAWPDARLFASHIVFYGDPDMINSTGGFINLAGYAWDRGIYRPAAEVRYPPLVFYPCGAAMFMDRRLLDEVGGFDEAYSYSFDDVELGWRALMAGHQVIYVAGAKVRHRFSSTVGRYNPRKLYLYERNRILCLCKNIEAATLRGVATESIGLYLHRIRVETMQPERGWGERASYLWRMLLAPLWNLMHVGHIRRQRKKLAAWRRVGDLELINRGLIFNRVDTLPFSGGAPLPECAPVTKAVARNGKSEIHMTAEDVEYLGGGWHSREYTPEGKRYRWTGATAAAVLADRGEPGCLIIETLLAHPHEASRVKVEVNGQHLGDLTVVNGPARHELKISPEAMNGYLDVRLNVGNPFNPAELSGTEDRRTLGIAITRIAVE